jgi:hypothetical protein
MMKLSSRERLLALEELGVGICEHWDQMQIPSRGSVLVMDRARRIWDIVGWMALGALLGMWFGIAVMVLCP